MEKLIINTQAAIIILCILFSKNLYCQDISFNLYGYDPCTHKYAKIDFFGLEKNESVFSVEDTSKTIFLKDTGVYILSYAIAFIDTTQIGKEYLINSLGNYSDTLQLISIDICYKTSSYVDFFGFCCCGEKCNGFQVDYFANGKKRIEGYFKEGLPIGSLKFYYPSGELKQIDKYNKDGKLKKRIYFDIHGNVQKQIFK